MQDLRVDVFKQLPNLKFLGLERNKLSFFKQTYMALRELASLEILCFYENPVNQIPISFIDRFCEGRAKCQVKSTKSCMNTISAGNFTFIDSNIYS